MAESTNGVTVDAQPLWQQHEARIKQLMEQAGFPNSMALYQAFKQFAQELTANDEQDVFGTCGKPVPGWWQCDLPAGHEGPCGKKSVAGVKGGEGQQ